MTGLFGTQIFWTTAAATVLILAAFTVVGRAWSRAFPATFRQSAHFYLAPVMGLGSFVLLGTAMGRHVPLGDSIVVPFAVLAILIAAVRYDPAIAGLKRDLALVAGFGLLCGASLLAPLYVHGALNAHNDAFTYLAHAHWLQTSAFSAQIPLDRVSPAATQVLLYQVHGFRMGASFLLGLLQAMLNIQWSLEIYPAVLIASIAACCLAVGFPIAELLRPLRLHLRLLLLALPSFGLGGLVFGANYGFLPQTVGLAVASGAIFASGAVLKSAAAGDGSVRSLAGLALPIAMLVAAAIFSYAEIAPFLAAGIGLGWLWFAVRSGAWRAMLLFGVALALSTVVLTNFELIRAYGSLRTQAGAVVGSPVAWSVLGFAGHALGIRAGAWDDPGYNSQATASAALNSLLTWDDPSFTVLTAAWALAFALLLLVRLRAIRRTGAGLTLEALVPTAALLLCLALAFLYFRYAVASPFPVGVGQSWSQFKLTEWANPFLTVLALALVACLVTGATWRYRGIVVALLAVAALGSSYIGHRRSTSIMDYYANVADLGAFYRGFRDAVLRTCPLERPIYLALGGSDHKFRQMVSLYLADRDLRSDWRDDGYISPYLSAERVSMPLSKGDCLVEPIRSTGATATATVTGPVRISVFDGRQRIEIVSVTGAHGHESSGGDWWRWVERSVAFRFKPSMTQDKPARLKLQFEYATRQDRPLTLTIGDGRGPPISLEVDGSLGQRSFSHIFEARAIADLVVTIRSEAEPQQLGEKDSRKVAFLIRNLSVSEAD